MAHVELSLSEVFAPASRPATLPPSESLTRWGVVVSEAVESCLLIDSKATVVAISKAACALLGLGVPADVIGLPLLNGGIRLLDFTAARAELTEQEIDKIPPLLALSSGRLARGLLRVRPVRADNSDITIDAISTPILAPAGGEVDGSLTFLSPV